jgi:hypothetical protein
MTSRIGELRLHLRVPGALEPEVPHLRAAVERTVVVGVIEELERRLHAALGDRAVIRVRHLALRWTLDAGTLGDAAAVVRLGDELARDLLAELAAQPPHERLRPRSPSIVAFASERHADAARLADLADGAGDAWFHAGSPDGAATWEAVAAAGARSLEEVVGWLDRMGRVEAALALAPAGTLAQVAAAMPAHAGAVALALARRAARAEAEAARPDAGAAQPGGAAASAPAAPALAGAPDAGSIERPGGPATTTPPAAPAAADAPSPSAAAVEPLAPPAPPDDATAATAIADDGGRAAVSAASTTALPAEPARRGEAPIPPPAPTAPLDPRAAEGAPAPAPRSDGVAIETRYAGLFYLIGRVLELDLAEALWAAGAPEGDVLAHAAAAILADDGDPAWRWFGGAFDRVPLLPALPAWAIGEVSAAVQHGLGRRLVAFGVTRTPDALGAELDGLAAAVPRPAPGDPATAHLVARVAAALAALVAARLRRPPSWPLLREVVARPGRAIVTPDAVRVILSAALVDLDHRRAGLDQDPGHVPWLGRRVHLEFAGGESL